jgi:ubiquinone/menaquinone biosynthesis C-methylase UbiE
MKGQVGKDMNHRPESADLPHRAGGAPARPGQFILQRRRRVAADFLSWPREHLVDIGCGNGAQTLFFADTFDRLTGVDIDPGFVAEFQAEIARRGLENRMEAVVGSGGPIPLPDACADVVTCFTVLEHVADEKATLAELRRLLKPGGRLLLTVPNRWWIFETHGADLPLLPWNRVPLVSWWPKRLHDRYARARIYRKREIRRLVREAGFQLDAVFNLTAPMDMISWAPLQKAVRATLFRTDRTSFPFLATEIMVAATK